MCFVIVHYKKLNAIIILIVIVIRLFFISDSLCCLEPLKTEALEIWSTSPAKPTSEDQLPKYASRDELVQEARKRCEKNLEESSIPEQYKKT